ncbi:hypothetical protein OF376_03170, partial [Ureaplasma miroungigenitalium]
RNLAKGLDEAIDLNKSSTFKPLIDKGLYEKTFLAEAEKQIANLKHDIRMYANSPFWKKLREQKATVGFTSRVGPSDLDVQNMNVISIYQPDDNPLLYTSPDFEDLPGLGLKFPVPDERGADLLDSQWSFGAQIVHGSGDSAAKTKVVNDLLDGFGEKFDYLIYVYNDKGAAHEYKGPDGESYRDHLVNNPGFAPLRLIKGSKKDHMIFMGNDGWSSTYGIAGTHWLLQKYSELFGMPKDELDGLKAKEKFK